jgi:hypothetical protein
MIGGVSEIARWADQTWTAILSLLEKVIVPDWNDWVNAIPILVVLGLLGPMLTLLFLAWLYYMVFVRRRGRVRTADPEPAVAERDEAGFWIIPPNTPFCAREGLLYPPNARRCVSCRNELMVRCPVDSTTRVASQDICRACGTKYVLGAVSTAVTIKRRSGPPEGGAAVA